MNQDAKKTALRMIPYGTFILTSESPKGTVSAATVNWVTQASFTPPLVVVGVKKDSGTFAIISESRAFALNVLGKGHKDLAFNFFKSHERDGDSIGGQPFEHGPQGMPLLTQLPAWLECKVVDIVEHGDHAVVIGEVTEAGVRAQPEGRADEATLWLRDLGEKLFYGG